MVSRSGRVSSFIFSLIFLTTTHAFATSFLQGEDPIGDSTHESLKVFRGKIESAKTLEVSSKIFTKLEVQVLEVYKGANRIQPNESIMVPGGVITNGKASRIAGVPQFEVGEECVFFVNPQSFLVDWTKYEVSMNAAGKRYVVIQSDAPIVSRSVTGSLSQVQESTDVQSLDSFVTKILEAQEPN